MLPRHDPAPGVHDFGNVISDYKPLRHVFRIENNADRKIVITDKIRSSTCCTNFGGLPSEVKDGEILEVPVESRTVGKMGNTRGEFVVHIDSPKQSSIVVELRANLLEQFELPGIVGGIYVPLNGDTKREFEVITRSKRGEPIVWPSTPGMSSQWQEQASKAAFVSEDIVESKRILVLTFAANKPGRYNERVAFSWSDGRKQDYHVAWDIDSPLRISPCSIILRHNEKTGIYKNCTILKRCRT